MDVQNDGGDAVERLLQETGLADKFTSAPHDEVAEVRRRLADQLEKIAKAAPEDEQGGTKVVVRGWSLRITGTIWPLAVCVVKLVVAAHDPTGISWKDAATGVIELLDKLSDEIHKLDPIERLVCTGIAQKRYEHRVAGLKPDSASRQDIVDFFTSRQEEVQTLDDVISALVEKKVLVREVDPQRGAIYYITF